MKGRCIHYESADIRSSLFQSTVLRSDRFDGESVCERNAELKPGAGTGILEFVLQSKNGQSHRSDRHVRSVYRCRGSIGEVGANHASHAAFGNYYDVDSQNHHSIHLALPPTVETGWNWAATGESM